MSLLVQLTPLRATMTHLLQYSTIRLHVYLTQTLAFVALVMTTAEDPPTELQSN